MRRISARLLALILLFSPVLSAGSEDTFPPAVDDLLQYVLRPPTTTYQGKIRTSLSSNGRLRTEDANVYFRPGNVYRWEFVNPEGKLSRTVVSDGTKEYVRVPGGKKVQEGAAVKSAAKLLGEDREKALLEANYKTSALPPRTEAGRSVLGLALWPKVAGKPCQEFWIDQETGVILRVKRFLPGMATSAETRFLEFTPNAALSDDLFLFKTEPGERVVAHDLDPDFLSLDALLKATGRSIHPPFNLPEGFVFESADFFEEGKTVLLQVRYTDGLAVLSLFRTEKAIQPAAPDIAPQPGAERLSGPIHTVQWKKGSYYYLLMGDLSKRLLETVSTHFK